MAAKSAVSGHTFVLQAPCRARLSVAGRAQRPHRLQQVQWHTVALCRATVSCPSSWSSFSRRPEAAEDTLRSLEKPERVQQDRSNGSAAIAVGASDTQKDGLTFPRGSAGAWDAAGVGNLVVRCFMGDDEQRWYMWYDGYSEDSAASNRPFPACVGLAVSDDGISWLRGPDDVTGQQGPSQLHDVGRVLGPNSDWWCHDTRSVSVSDVQIFSSDAVNTGVGVYWMFYTGGCFEAATVPNSMHGLPEGQDIEGLRTRIGLAMSQDGRNWARIEANHHSGALFDAGGDGEWDAVLNGAPQVLALGPSDMRMYYHSFDADRGRWVVGAATSRDGFNWQKKGPIFGGGEASEDCDARGAAAHCVVKDVDSRRFVMFYEAVAADESRSISVAVSRDGLSGWRRLGRPVLTAGPPDSWDSGAVGSPAAVSMAGGKWRLYYGGRQAGGKGQWQGFGLALTDADDSEAFEGVRIGFKRRKARP